MKSRIRSFIEIFVFWILVFVIQKPVFMIYYHSLMKGCSIADWFSVMGHGLKLDLSMAGYLTAIPALALIVSVWIQGKWLDRFVKGYFVVAAILVSMAFVVNLALYDFWGFPLDSTPLFYFFSSPAEAFASVSVWFVLLGLLVFIACTFAIVWIAEKLFCFGSQRVVSRIPATVVLILLTGALFIPVRGGVTVSSTNIGKVYFSENQRLNHAAVNPLFSVLESLSHREDFGSQYRFMGNAEADKLFRSMSDTSSDSTDVLLNTDRPDVLIIVMESFSSKLMGSLGGERNVAVNLDRIASEGVLFTHFYANSFRTDRGLVAVLSGYPAQPTMSIMKYPHKTAHLPSIASCLVKAGYSTKYFYGGDADFTNMRSYLVSSGFTNIVSDVDFPVGDRLSKWGVPDHLVFGRLLDDIRKDNSGGRKFRVLQTSSSHEPFDVPYHRLKNERLNAFAYTDNCIGKFLSQFRRLPQWKHTLVVLVPDHLGCYPQNISNFVLERYQIPLIFTGGAVKCPRKIDVIGSQQDIAATLLGQMRLPHHDFKFSKDMMSKGVPHFAFFTVPDAMGMVTADNSVIYDNQQGRAVLDLGKTKGKNLRMCEAYLQKLYDDISKR